MKLGKWERVKFGNPNWKYAREKIGKGPTKGIPGTPITYEEKRLKSDYASIIGFYNSHYYVVSPYDYFNGEDYTGNKETSLAVIMLKVDLALLERGFELEEPFKFLEEEEMETVHT